MAIKIVKGDITKVACDAIVNPANSYGYMGGGAAGAIKRAGGTVIEEEAVSKAPINVGEAISTNPGRLPCKYVIHAPTMTRPAMRINMLNVKMATQAAFRLGTRLKIKSIAFPGMGTGVGGVSIDDAAKVMVETGKIFESNFEEIIFVGFNDELVNAFKKYI